MDNKAKAYYNIGILDTIFIYNIIYDIDNFVVFRHTRQKRLHKAKVRCNKQGKFYFVSYGKKYYLSEFLMLEGQG